MYAIRSYYAYSIQQMLDSNEKKQAAEDLEKLKQILDNLVESVPTTQLLLLLNYRPDYTHKWERKTYYTQLV